MNVFFHNQPSNAVNFSDNVPGSIEITPMPYFPLGPDMSERRKQRKTMTDTLKRGKGVSNKRNFYRRPIQQPNKKVQY